MIPEFKPCPECGKAMSEEAGWPGLWCCPDSKIRLNDAAPFKFKCNGMEITDKGVALFEREFVRLISELN